MPVAKMYHDTMHQLANRLPEEKRAQFIYFMERGIDAEKLEKIALDTMVKHFTAEELDALADFYGSPVGESILQKFGPYMADAQTAIMPELFRVIREWEKRQ
jgi:hypothetical protein